MYKRVAKPDAQLFPAPDESEDMKKFSGLWKLRYSERRIESITPGSRSCHTTSGIEKYKRSQKSILLPRVTLAELLCSNLTIFWLHLRHLL